MQVYFHKHKEAVKVKVPKELKYTREHEWVRLDDNVVTIGVTDYAQSEMGDVVFVELPEVGSTKSAGDQLAVVESVKAVSDVFSPVSGTVESVNESLEDTPELINDDCYGEGWIARIKIADSAELDELMSAEEYEEYTAE